MSLQHENSSAAPCDCRLFDAREFAPEERALLLQIAHDSILAALENREISMDHPSPHLAEPRGGAHRAFPVFECRSEAPTSGLRSRHHPVSRRRLETKKR